MERRTGGGMAEGGGRGASFVYSDPSNHVFCSCLLSHCFFDTSAAFSSSLRVSSVFDALGVCSFAFPFLLLSVVMFFSVSFSPTLFFSLIPFPFFFFFFFQQLRQRFRLRERGRWRGRPEQGRHRRVRHGSDRRRRLGRLPGGPPVHVPGVPTPRADGARPILSGTPRQPAAR